MSLAGPELLGGMLDVSVGAIDGAGVGPELLPPQPANAAPISVNSTVRRRADGGASSDGVEASLLGLNMITLSCK